jgi:hypothetical protein
MSRIQIADLNSSEFGFLYDVNDAEILAIVGGFLFWLKGKPKPFREPRLFK